MNKKIFVPKDTTGVDYEHHLYNPDGSLRGLYVVKEGTTHKLSIWDRIEEAIQDYAKIHPNEMQLQVIQNSYVRAGARNDFSAAKEKSLRWGASLPVGLMFRLQAIDPELFEDPLKFTKFIKRYKGLATCRKV